MRSERSSMVSKRIERADVESDEPIPVPAPCKVCGGIAFETKALAHWAADRCASSRPRSWL
jgi:hypothetical protein